MPTLPRFLRLAFAVVAACAVSLAQAGEVRWKEEMFVYTANGKNLKEFLREFGASQGLLVVVAKEVEGTVNGKFNLKPASVLEILCASFGFIWHTEGNVLYVTPSSDVRSDVVRVEGAGVAQLRQALERLNIPDRRFPIVYDNRQNTAVVSGPSRYVELVVQTARSLGQNQSPSSEAEVRIFPLRFAWAADSIYKIGSKEQKLSGVATVLQELYGNSATGGMAPARRSQSGGSYADFPRARGLAGQVPNAFGKGRNQEDFDAAVQEAANLRVAQAREQGQDQGLPQFRADGRMNAVIVRDLPERMAAHEAAIRAMDVKPGMVEIEVRIIEVNSDAAESLGVDWRFRSRRVDLQLGKGGLPTLSWGTALADTAPATGPVGAIVSTPTPNGVLTTVLGDAGRFLIARVNALAQDGRANLLATPKILTLDNVEAVMDDLSTFFVRVSGNLDVNLFDVSVGTSLRVTPLIVAEEGKEQQVKLAVRIEDGSLSSQAVDQVPIVRRSTITTQSLIGDGQALLIAGYTQESDVNDEAGVPGLSSIPVMGRLFKHTYKSKKRVDRFFLITPRVVPMT